VTAISTGPVEWAPLSLFDEDVTLVASTLPSSETIAARFAEFHRLNPWVCVALERLAADMFRRGKPKIGIRMLWEVVRWQYERTTVDPSSSFKANDHYHTRYARLLIDRHPEWEGRFELRALRAE
jgi:hypothetical protein